MVGLLILKLLSGKELLQSVFESAVQSRLRNMDDGALEEPAASTDTRARQAPVIERLSRYGVPVMSGASNRRSRLLQRRQEDQTGRAAAGHDRASFTPALRNALTFQRDLPWALYPMEHAWMLSAVEGNYDTLLEFVSEDPLLLTRRDFISGYSVLHWLAKSGRDDTLLKLLHHAEKAGGGASVSVDVRGSGGLTPLHVASMHGHDTVVKLLVGAFGANVDAMDYSGRRAWQYLRPDAPVELKELLGMWDDEHAGGGSTNANKNCNNSSGVVVAAPCEQVDGLPAHVNSLRRTRFGILRMFSFRANRR
ncbi:ankyrin repeat domain-containing protein SOWAHC isoform X1 [Nerophis lumbriciformis]|uniref:ankyrin repeat domain-containing protein SOWAHC isoform X1 n=2 Tax=Nerophis lumbriciformis TaxID=546530 RepID=UPI002ADF003E|nr:ankyrin repeat domain-containing protein SOWAHD-like isoform X1 [Nerophis lumbriciformis]